MRIINAYATEDFQLFMKFDDGTWVLDFKNAGFDHPKALELLKNSKMFMEMELEDGASPLWPNGFSLDPERVRILGKKVVMPFKAAGSITKADLMKTLNDCGIKVTDHGINLHDMNKLVSVLFDE